MKPTKGKLDSYWASASASQELLCSLYEEGYVRDCRVGQKADTQLANSVGVELDRSHLSPCPAARRPPARPAPRPTCPALAAGLAARVCQCQLVTPASSPAPASTVQRWDAISEVKSNMSPCILSPSRQQKGWPACPRRR